MNLYKISQSVNNDYNTYDSAIVAAPDEDKARVMHPNGHKSDRLDRRQLSSHVVGTWVRHSGDVTVELIGVAADGTQRSVICSSFNAG
jgi:hypothetical protein|tara:strand:- start:9298 stop:9561 length:264 start_codon:yes stop_codon:yes gene_type:complete